jgi:hypothetical protein
LLPQNDRSLTCHSEEANHIACRWARKFGRRRIFPFQRHGLIFFCCSSGINIDFQYRLGAGDSSVALVSIMYREIFSFRPSSCCEYWVLLPQNDRTLACHSEEANPITCRLAQRCGRRRILTYQLPYICILQNGYKWVL